MADKKFFKITEELMEEHSYDEIINLLEDKVKEDVQRTLEMEKYDMLLAMIDCESPIERMLALGLNKAFQLHNMDTMSNYIDIGVENQVVINNYRTDFYIESNLTDCSAETFKLIVECDGHDFHEKTKEQVAKDKKRERDLINEGYTILRFSGSEIYKNPFTCAREVKKVIYSHFSKKVKR